MDVADKLWRPQALNILPGRACDKHPPGKSSVHTRQGGRKNPQLPPNRAVGKTSPGPWQDFRVFESAELSIHIFFVLNDSMIFDMMCFVVICACGWIDY